MIDRRAIALVREIRDLYARSCALADRYNGAIDAEHENLRKACRGRRSNVEELNHFDNVFDRQEAAKKALANPRVRIRVQLVQVVFWCISFGVIWTCLIQFGSVYLGMAAALLIGVGAVYVQHQVVWKSDAFRRPLREQLAARNVPICIECGYDLRGQTVPRCPECGQPTKVALPAQPVGGGCDVG